MDRPPDAVNPMRAAMSILPLLVAATPASQCRLSTDSGTGELHISGTVHFLDVKHGCWQLEADSGQRYELVPAQAPASVLRDRAWVSLVGQALEGSDTGCQVGMPVQVRRVVSVEAGVSRGY